MLSVVLILFLAIHSPDNASGQDSCAANNDFGVAYDGQLVFSVASANQSCVCNKYYTAGTGYFGDDVTLSTAAVLNFANSLGQKIVMWSTSPTAYYGFTMSSNTLEYHVDGPASNHVFYQGSTQIFRIAGTGAVTASGTLSVSGLATLASATVSGAASFGSTSSFGGLATFNGGLTVAAGTTQLLGTLSVTGTTSLPATTITGNAVHSSTSSFTGTATFSGGLTVASGATSLSGTLSVTGGSTFSSTVTVNAGASISVTGGGGVSAGPASFTSLSASGTSSLAATSISSTLGVSGLLTAGGGLSVTGGVLTVAGTATLNSVLNVAGVTTVTGLLTANGGINIAAGTVVDFGVGATREVSAGKMGYGIFSGGGGLDIVGAGTGARQINMWDNVRVQSNFVAAGSITAGALTVGGVSTFGSTVNVGPAGGGIILKAPANGQGWGSAARPYTEAHIVNDYTGTNSLMIVGSSPSGGTRVVQLWDQLTVNGATFVSGLLSVSGAFTSANTRTFRAYDTRGCCPCGLAAYGPQFYLSIPLTQAAHVMISASNIRRYSGRADLCLYINGGEVNRYITYTPVLEWQTGTVHWSGQLSATTHSVYIADCSGIASIWGCGGTYGVITAITVG